MTDLHEDLLRRDTFHLEVDGISGAGFSRCSGLESEAEVLEFREGGHDCVRQFRGRSRPGRIVLERGVVRDRALWEWFVTGAPREGAVLLLDTSGKERMRWTFRAGWPSRWVGPELDADARGVAIESVEIVHEGIAWHVR